KIYIHIIQNKMLNITYTQPAAQGYVYGNSSVTNPGFTFIVHGTLFIENMSFTVSQNDYVFVVNQGGKLILKNVTINTIISGTTTSPYCINLNGTETSSAFLNLTNVSANNTNFTVGNYGVVTINTFDFRADSFNPGAVFLNLNNSSANITNLSLNLNATTLAQIFFNGTTANSSFINISWVMQEGIAPDALFEFNNSLYDILLKNWSSQLPSDTILGHCNNTKNLLVDSMNISGGGGFQISNTNISIANSNFTELNTSFLLASKYNNAYYSCNMMSCRFSMNPELLNLSNGYSGHFIRTLADNVRIESCNFTTVFGIVLVYHHPNGDNSIIINNTTFTDSRFYPSQRFQSLSLNNYTIGENDTAAGIFISSGKVSIENSTFLNSSLYFIYSQIDKLENLTFTTRIASGGSSWQSAYNITFLSSGNAICRNWMFYPDNPLLNLIANNTNISLHDFTIFDTSFLDVKCTSSGSVSIYQDVVVSVDIQGITSKEGVNITLVSSLEDEPRNASTNATGEAVFSSVCQLKYITNTMGMTEVVPSTLNITAFYNNTTALLEFRIDSFSSIKQNVMVLIKDTESPTIRLNMPEQVTAYEGENVSFSFTLADNFGLNNLTLMNGDVILVTVNYTGNKSDTFNFIWTPEEFGNFTPTLYVYDINGLSAVRTVEVKYLITIHVILNGTLVEKHNETIYCEAGDIMVFNFTTLTAGAITELNVYIVENESYTYTTRLTHTGTASSFNYTFISLGNKTLTLNAFSNDKWVGELSLRFEVNDSIPPLIENLNFKDNDKFNSTFIYINWTVFDAELSNCSLSITLTRYTKPIFRWVNNTTEKNKVINYSIPVNFLAEEIILLNNDVILVEIVGNDSIGHKTQITLTLHYQKDVSPVLFNVVPYNFSKVNETYFTNNTEVYFIVEIDNSSMETTIRYKIDILLPQERKTSQQSNVRIDVNLSGLTKGSYTIEFIAIRNFEGKEYSSNSYTFNFTYEPLVLGNERRLPWKWIIAGVVVFFLLVIILAIILSRRAKKKTVENVELVDDEKTPERIEIEDLSLKSSSGNASMNQEYYVSSSAKPGSTESLSSSSSSPTDTVGNIPVAAAPQTPGAGSTTFTNSTGAQFSLPGSSQQPNS
ncbi:MAG: hypothetical protein QW728_05835, partial [Thermoplasmata archaeon]